MKMNLGLQILSYLVIFYLFCCAFMYLRQEAFLFFPTVSRHEGHGQDRVIDYQLQRGAESLRGWLVNPGMARDKLLLYYGGNAEDIFQNIDEYRDIQAATLFVAYRGYGPSSGKPGEAELYEDALAVFDDIVGSASPQEVYLIGRSLGSGVACFVAAHRPVRGAILVTPYDSIANVAKAHFPWLPVSLLLRHRFASLDLLPAIHCPLLIIYAGRDNVIAPHHTENLLRHIAGEKEVVYITEADHGTIEMYPVYWPAVLRFISRDEEEVQRDWSL